MQFTVERLTKGRRVGGKCRARRKRGKRCTISKMLAGSFTVQGVQGVNSFKFSGRIGGGKLKRGKYRLYGTPTDAAGNVGSAAGG